MEENPACDHSHHVESNSLTTPGASAVIPVYNSAPMLLTLVRRLEAVFLMLAVPYEIILINDGSVDDSWSTLVALCDVHPNLVCINLMRNYGQHNALLAGIRAAHHSVIVTMDDDLQNPPEEIPKLLERLKDGYDVVYGTPAAEQHGVLRDISSQIVKLIMQVAMGAQAARQISAFRAFRTPIRQTFANHRSPYVSVDILLTWGTSRFAAVPVRCDPRLAGKSTYSFRRLVAHALNVMTAFSTVPLQLASWLGFGCTLFGIAVLVYVFGRLMIEGGSVPGFPFLASLIAIFSGTQLFAIGIIGEYLARMHFRLQERPSYAIEQLVQSAAATLSRHAPRDS